jgi:hypothetical protein
MVTVPFDFHSTSYCIRHHNPHLLHGGYAASVALKHGVTNLQPVLLAVTSPWRCTHKDSRSQLQPGFKSIPIHLISGCIIRTRGIKMKRQQVIDILRQKRVELSGRYHVALLTLFGSVARDEARLDSDVDILVEFSEPVGLFLFSN